MIDRKRAPKTTAVVTLGKATQLTLGHGRKHHENQRPTFYI